ncbi:aminotransferase [Thalassobaculum sp.]|uniref:aminotransferase n=1 Tax=Thalassobaculum sp. TaxID=2022740 RepID=UPI0032ED7286
MPENSSELARQDRDHHLHPFTDPQVLIDDGGPTVIVRGQGCTLWDEDGRSYLDALAGLWCVNVGYGRAELAKVAADQMERLAYYNTFFKTTSPPTAALAARLAALMPPGLDRVLFANSGSEALDSIVRLSRHFWALQGKPDKWVMIGREEGYHGSTLATISLGQISSMHAQGRLPLPGFSHVKAPYAFRHAPAADPAAFAETAAGWVDAKISEIGPERVAAVVIEPVQGAGGVIIPPPGHLLRVQEICRKHDVLFVLDEVVSAFGRLGAWSAAERFGLSPDFMALAKGLSSGYQPISAVMIGERVAQSLIQGGDLAHGFTYSGHPVAAAVALANLDILAREGLVERVRDDLEGYFAAALGRLADHPLVGEARSIGLIGAVELVQQREPRIPFDPPGLVAAVIRDQMQQRGIILRAVRDALVIAPPLVVTHAEIDRIVGTLGDVLDLVRRELGLVEQERELAAATAGGRALDGLTCLVTGASRGIGAAVAERYAAEGARVVLAARSQVELDAVAGRIRAAGGQAATLAIDLSDPTAVEGLAGRLAGKLGGLDVLVANHGMLGSLLPTAELDATLFDRVVEVNVTSAFRLLRELDPLIRASRSGRVLMVSSGAAEGEHADWSAYAASKAALEALARAYAAETRETSVRVNVIDPGEVRTGMRASAFPNERPERLPEPAAITDAFVRLASPACQFTGARVPAETRKEGG